jgi:Na+/H+-translocating membrane pyrophosphatase
MNRQLFLALGLGAPVVAAAFAYYLVTRIHAHDPGNERMVRIAGLIRAGAMAFLRVEYSVLAVFAR